MRNLCLLICALGLAGSLAWAQQRNWTVPNTRPLTVAGVQSSAEPVITCRRVAFRTKLAGLDDMGALTIYPVVRAPTGKIYSGFIRRYAAKAVGDRWLFWTFPTGFRAPGVKPETEEGAAYGEGLLDALEEDAAKVLPQGQYQVKWVINNRLVDNGDSFRYGYRVVAAAQP
jgi:hypothetical protein